MQGTNLGTGRELLLHLELVDGELRGQDLGKAEAERYWVRSTARGVL